MIDALQTRAGMGKATRLQHLGRPLEDSEIEKLRRHTKTLMRQPLRLTATERDISVIKTRVPNAALMFGNNV